MKFEDMVLILGFNIMVIYVFIIGILIKIKKLEKNG